MTGFTGTLAYMAPEVALRKPYNEKVDIYSFGIILWQMVTGETPFDGMSKATYIERVVMGGLRPSIPREVPKDLATLMQQCWDEDPKRRPSCMAILAALDGLMYALDNSGGLLSFIPKLFSRSSNVSKIVPNDTSTEPLLPEVSSDESILVLSELSTLKTESNSTICSNLNASPSNVFLPNSTPTNIQQTRTAPTISSIKRRKFRQRDRQGIRRFQHQPSTA